MQSEAKFKQHLRDGFEACFRPRPCFWLALVASVMQMPGIPDLFIAAEQRTAWIEAKVDDNWLSKTQAIVLPTMAQSGARVTVLATDMRMKQDQRRMLLSVYDGPVIKRDTHVFSWSDHKSPMFWGAVMGAWA